jgi:hypothetical protein
MEALEHAANVEDFRNVSQLITNILAKDPIFNFQVVFTNIG